MRERDIASKAFDQATCVQLGLVGLVVALSLLGLTAVGAPPVPKSGERGEVPRAAVLNFVEAAKQAALRPRPAERRVIPFMRGPTSFPVPEDAVMAPPAPSALAPPPGPGVSFLTSPSAALSFEGLGDDGMHIPPDTTGAVGLNHLMVTLNSEVRIQNRQGAEMSKMTLESFWSSTGATGTFDPKVLYDPFNNRWIFVAISDKQVAASSLLIGVTQNSDPTGTWNLFRVDVDATDTVWADYPSIGFTKDWVVVTLNMFTVANNSYSRADIYAFNKANLYSNTSASFTLFSTTNGFALAPAITYDNSLTTAYLVQNFNGNSSGNGFIELSTITGSVGSEVFTQGTTLVSTANPWDCAGAGGSDFAPQKDTTDKIQTNDCRMLVVVYRNASLWATQAAFLPAGTPTRSAVQWWQFQPNGTLQQFGRVDDSSGVNFFAFPSIAVNSQNDVLLGYACFSANTFASACYSFRDSGDAANTLRDSVLLKSGEQTYFKTFGGGQNRWGDYSAAQVDPVNDLDFWTLQEYASSPDFPFVDNNDRWGTWWGKVLASGAGGPAEFANTGAITINDNTTASPYPSTINVSSLTGVITRLDVKLNGFAHTFPADADMLLVGPTGANATIFSDVGSSDDVTGLNLALTEYAPALLPDSSALTSGVFQPRDNTVVGEAFPGPAPAPSGSSLLTDFNGTNPNGTWKLFVMDDAAGDTGSLAGGWALQIYTGSAFTNSSSITINDSGTPPTAASLYPSTITVSSLTGVVSKVRVMLHGYSHTFPDDVDILLEGPTGATAILMSDAGDNVDAVAADLLFDDEAATSQNDEASQPLTPVKPFNFGSGADSFPSPAPTPSGNSQLSIFNGTDPNGTWKLYVVDDETADSGSLGGGWTLLIETVAAESVAVKKRRGQVTSE